MGAGGVRKNTRYGNTTQPYAVGFLNQETDAKEYNVAVYDELQKVQNSTTHMFQGLDDVKNEIENRTKALQALHLTVNDTFDEVTTEIAGVKTAMGNIKIETLTDADGKPLTGILQGIQTKIGDDLTTIQGNINTLDGKLTIVQQSLGTANANITNTTQLLQTFKGDYEAIWKVQSTINGITGSVGLYNRDGRTVFAVNANDFIVRTGSGAGAQQLLNVENGRIRMPSAYINRIQSDNFKGMDGNHNGGQGWLIREDGYAQFNNVNVRGDIYANSGTFNGVVNANGGNFNNVTIANNCTIRGNLDGASGHFSGTVDAEHINGDTSTMSYHPGGSGWRAGGNDHNWYDLSDVWYYSRKNQAVAIACIGCKANIALGNTSGGSSSSGAFSFRYVIDGQVGQEFQVSASGGGGNSSHSGPANVNHFAICGGGVGKNIRIVLQGRTDSLLNSYPSANWGNGAVIANVLYTGSWSR